MASDAAIDCEVPEGLPDPADFEIPPIEDLVCAKNTEQYYLDASQDSWDYKRPMISIRSCPFACKDGGECSKQALQRAQVWSVYGYKCALGYLCNHGMQSSYHKLSKDEAYEQVINRWGDLEWHVEEDTFEGREAYRHAVDASNQQKRDQGGGGGGGQKKLQAQAKGDPGAKRQKSSSKPSEDSEMAQLKNELGQTNAAVQSLMAMIATGQMPDASGAGGSGDAQTLIPAINMRNLTHAQAALTMAIFR